MSTFGLPAYNPQDIKDEYDLVPDGIYNAVIESAETKQTDSGHGYLNIMTTITGPSMAGRKIFNKLFFWPAQSHPKAQTMLNMANKMRMQIGEAIGNPNWGGPSDIIGKPVVVKVGVSKSKDPQYDDQNEVKKFQRDPGAVAPVVAPAQQGHAAPAAAQSGMPGWAGK